jgi:hypothetical protein
MRRVPPSVRMKEEVDALLRGGEAGVLDLPRFGGRVVVCVENRKEWAVVAVDAGVRLPTSKEFVGARPFARPQLPQLPQPPQTVVAPWRVCATYARVAAGVMFSACVCEMLPHERLEPGASASSLEHHPRRGAAPPV